MSPIPDVALVRSLLAHRHLQLEESKVRSILHGILLFSRLNISRVLVGRFLQSSVELKAFPTYYMCLDVGILHSQSPQGLFLGQRSLLQKDDKHPHHRQSLEWLNVVYKAHVNQLRLEE